MTDHSPFVVYRSEYEAKHLYYLPNDFGSLEQPIPIYLVGTRGTGKTTLLKAMNWRERIFNDSLRRQLSDEPFSKHYIGVYLRLPQVQLNVLANWLQCEEKLLYAQFLALYLDLLWVEEVASAIADLLAEGVLRIDPAAEHECISAVVKAWGKSAADFCSVECRTTKGLAEAVRRLRKALEDQAREGANPTAVAGKVPIGQFGEFGRVAGRLLGALCDASSGPEKEERRWYFKVCMDESECLDDFQQAVVNSVVRLSEWPTFFVLSYVHLPRERAGTLIPNLTIQKADHRFVELDDMNDAEFRTLAEGVATVRVREALGDNEVTFDSRRLLGKLELDRVAESILRESERPEARELLAAAEELKGDIRGRVEGSYEDGSEARDASLPVIETYLMKRLGLPPSDLGPRWERRRHESAEFRKKSVAAYLSICRDLGAQVRYASADMVLQMSDKSIRDFLSQIDAIYRAAERPLEKFLAEEIPLKGQIAALRRASEEKRQSLKSSGVSLPNETGRIVDALAQLTADAQSRSSDNRHLKTTERGIFEIGPGDLRQTGLAALRDRIRDAALAGFLKLTCDDESGLRFRVHTSLAAAYGFSYRGAYYLCPVRATDLEKLRLAHDQIQFRALITKVAARIAGEPNSESTSLFPEDRS